MLRVPGGRVAVLPEAEGGGCVTYLVSLAVSAPGDFSSGHMARTPCLVLVAIGEPWVISVKTLTFPQFWSGAFCGQEPSLAEARLATEPGCWGQLRGTRGGEQPPALPLSEGSPNPLRI